MVTGEKLCDVGASVIGCYSSYPTEDLHILNPKPLNPEPLKSLGSAVAEASDLEAAPVPAFAGRRLRALGRLDVGFRV